MAVTENGRAIDSVKDRTDGEVVGLDSRRGKKSKSFTAWLINSVARLTIWYALITAIFRCPSSLSDVQDSSPQICKPYLIARSQVHPYIHQYYDTYASPYVEKVRPYADQLNQRVVSPAAAVAKKNYDAFAAPRIDQARAYGQAQWEKTVLPQVQLAQERASQLYSIKIAPQVAKASSLTSPYYPYYEYARDNAANVHKKHILPTVELSKPYLKNAYTSSHNFVVNTGLPTVQYFWARFIIFVDGTLWPTVKGLYGDNVKPQLVMISERIAKYQEGRKLKAAMDEVESSIQATSETFTTLTSTATEEAPEATPSFEESPKSAEKEKPKATPEQIASDLNMWQTKFAVAADKGSEDLAQRVEEIVQSIMKSNIDGEGKGLATALQKTAEVEIMDIKSKINSVIAAMPEDASDAKEAAEKEILDAIRAAGLNIRDRANAIRMWYSKYEAEIVQRTAAASESTLEVLDGIRDLGLQEIGMRWAWLDGVTYKDWAKYHELKKKFDEWRTEVRDTAINHRIVDEAKKAGEVIVEDSMEVAADAAKELANLKKAASWKIDAHDSTDNFDHTIMPLSLIAAKEKLAQAMDVIAEKALNTGSSLSSDVDGTKEFQSIASAESVSTSTDNTGVDSVTNVVASAVVGATEAAEDGASSASEVLDNIHSSVSSAIHPPGATESVASEASTSMKSMATEASVSIESAVSGISEGVGKVESVAGERVGSVASMASSYVESAATAASSAVIGDEPGVIEQAKASASSIVHDIWPSSSLADTASAATSSVADAAAEIASSASSLATSASSVVSSASSHVFAGAMAQDVTGHAPILDEMFDNVGSAFSETMQSIVDDAGDKYALVTNAVIEALQGTPTGAVESMTSLASEQYASALAAASKALYGSQGTGESIASVASGKYSDAVAAASAVIYGTPGNPLIQQANSLYSAATVRVQESYSHAMSIASQQISGTPKPIHEKVFSSIESAYSGSLETASARLDAALSAAVYQYSAATSAAASLVATPTQGPLQSISSVASARLQEALSAAKAQYESAKTAVGANPTPAHQQYITEVQRRYYEAMGIAHERYSEFAAAASTAVYGPPSGSVESIASVASANWEVLVSKASASIYGAPTPVYASVISQVGEFSAQVTDSAAAQYEALSLFVSELVVGKEPDFTESVMSRLSQAYYTGYHVTLAASASSLAGEAYVSVSSVMASHFTAPPEVSSILDSVTDQLNAAVKAASLQVYGTKAGIVDQATSIVAEGFASATSLASEAAYGTPVDYANAASSQISDAMSSAQEALSIAIYGSQTGYAEAAASSFASATKAAAENFESVTEAAGSMYDTAAASMSSLIYGEQKGAVESAQSRLVEAVDSARSAIAAMASTVGESGAEAVEAIKSSADDAASSVSSVVGKVMDRVKDEL